MLALFVVSELVTALPVVNDDVETGDRSGRGSNSSEPRSFDSNALVEALWKLPCFERVAGLFDDPHRRIVGASGLQHDGGSRRLPLATGRPIACEIGRGRQRGRW